MSNKKTTFSRREFIQSAAAAGLGSALIPLAASQGSASAQGPEEGGVPTRAFGKTGRQVSMLSLGGVLSIHDQLMFRQALKMGVTYWDTADSYGWGRNEKAIGKYLARYPEDRQKIFLVTKAATSDPQELTEKLETSLQRMQTSYVDMYLIHYVRHAKTELTKAVKTWAEKAKAQEKIRFFGFSTHANMQDSMLTAADLGWIDGIMMSYNYRLMVKDSMRRAVDACVKAGIGLTAMKTQAAFSANFYASIGSKTDDALEMTDHFTNKGYTAEQAKLKAVWENPHIASICSAMPNMTILQANVAAAVNRKKLSSGDKQRLGQYARSTAAGYCAGCADICEAAMSQPVPISDIMRCAMYYNSYGDRAAASKLFDTLTPEVKQLILDAEYDQAEGVCPQKIQIAEVLRQTCRDLA
jgi:hypothetical protein